MYTNQNTYSNYLEVYTKPLINNKTNRQVLKILTFEVNSSVNPYQGAWIDPTSNKQQILKLPSYLRVDLKDIFLLEAW